jgi:hypothetical protein
VVAYLALLIASPLITVAVMIVRARRDPKRSQSRAIFLARDIFHLLLGSTLLILLLSDFVTPLVALIISAVLLIGFEYGIVVVRKFRS